MLDPSIALRLDSIDENAGADLLTNPGTLLRNILTRGGTVAITDADGDPQGIAVTGSDESDGGPADA